MIAFPIDFNLDDKNCLQGFPESEVVYDASTSVYDLLWNDSVRAYIRDQTTEIHYCFAEGHTQRERACLQMFHRLAGISQDEAFIGRQFIAGDIPTENNYQNDDPSLDLNELY